MSPHIVKHICQSSARLASKWPSSYWASAGEIANGLPLARSTVYRYMPKLVERGLFESRSYQTVNKTMTSYCLTDKGEEFLSKWKELHFENEL